ncbi:alpha-galactosidase [Chitinophaga pendula]|uniref:alpha-galactosidase n=1 Tax=Chitinophaga TaxID=79328 RepID=UPI000BB09273|nr:MULTISPECIES: alpha-galactosidase [Chitinophaga]ASZ13253.1 alpha-galactosidase [Chitinophaga sp. MD30]UCJ09125.1 alpha-galactosidase [Chitinophaga pendula]
MRKILRIAPRIMTAVAMLLLVCTVQAAVPGDWKIVYDKGSKALRITSGASKVDLQLYASYKWNGRLVTAKDYARHTVAVKAVRDAFGRGSLLQVTYRDGQLPTLVQSFYQYAGKDYLLTDFTLEGAGGSIASNYMAPVNLADITPVVGEGRGRALFVPFDNDKWIRFQSHPLDFTTLTSYETTAVFDGDSRKGLVVGSVEHDFWKSAVLMDKAGGAYTLTCYGGVADSTTRDLLPHGAREGKVIKSPKVLLGVFSDWRVGMEAYGAANAIVAPPRAWKKAMPMGWNSWGVLQFNISYQKALEVSDFFHEELQPHHFVNGDGEVVIGLDSGWDRFTEEQLKDFVRHCKANGQMAGIYWTPFTDWGKRPDAAIKEAPQYRFKDVYIYANGQPQELDGAYAIDPTHPAIEQRMKEVSALFRRCGFQYVKVDFMAHGAINGDKWYNTGVRSGIAAYNYGMQLLDKYFGDMYINLSIAPIFPAQYAQSRRIACDAWNKIKDTEYTLNAVSYGWWIDKIYRYNDADHVVLQQASEGENRARVTSAVVTGLFISGDDFSKEGSEEGKVRAKQFLTNAEVNAAAMGRSFRPVEGTGERSEDQFVLEDGKGNIYYAIFNYTEELRSVKLSLARLGLDVRKRYQLRNLWAHADIDAAQPLQVPAKDVLFLKISSK